MKVVEKSKLFGEEQLHQARQECAIQSLFESSTIVKIIEYTENEDEIIIVMEHVKDAQWLETKIDVKKREIKNETKIKSIARDVLMALKQIHASNFIHADIKL